MNKSNIIKITSEKGVPIPNKDIAETNARIREAMKKLKKPKVKLMRLFINRYDQREINKHIISNGIWQTIGVKEEYVKEWKKILRVYTMQCVMPYHPDLKIGETRTMYEDWIIATCDEFKLVKLDTMEQLRKTL